MKRRAQLTVSGEEGGGGMEMPTTEGTKYFNKKLLTKLLGMLM